MPMGWMPVSSSATLCSLLCAGRRAMSGRGRRALFAAALALAPMAMSAARARAQDAAPSALSETYGDWVVQCAAVQGQPQGEAGEAKNNCQMSQELRQGKTGQRALLVVLNRQGKDKTLSGTIIAPFGLNLQVGLSLLVKQDVYIKSAYKTCLPQGCIAPIVANGQFEAALRENEKLIVAMTASDTGQPVRLDVSLQGFAQGLDRLTTLSARNGRQ